MISSLYSGKLTVKCGGRKIYIESETPDLRKEDLQAILSLEAKVLSPKQGGKEESSKPGI